MTTKDELIHRLSQLSDNHGSLLLELMDRYNKINLKDIIVTELENFIAEKGIGLNG